MNEHNQQISWKKKKNAEWKSRINIKLCCVWIIFYFIVSILDAQPHGSLAWTFFSSSQSKIRIVHSRRAQLGRGAWRIDIMYKRKKSGGNVRQWRRRIYCLLGFFFSLFCLLDDDDDDVVADDILCGILRLVFKLLDFSAAMASKSNDTMHILKWKSIHLHSKYK